MPNSSNSLVFFDFSFKRKLKFKKVILKQFHVTNSTFSEFPIVNNSHKKTTGLPTCGFQQLTNQYAL